MAVPSRHKEDAPRRLGFAIATCSSSRHILRIGLKEFTDPSGDEAARLLEGSGHEIVVREVLPDEPAAIRRFLMEALGDGRVDCVIFIGGTGVSRDDSTIEAVEPLLDKKLPGFGELLRSISYLRVGSPAMMTRALAGTVYGRAVFCLPGSPEAVETAVRELIIPEAGHIIKLCRG
ncbi:MAG: molybdenum cofactor biosynthesis protein B [Candidatus Bathyarchaeia archaeon]|nr:molybdenum cofactor biosynthesis protein MoaB [Candidatus Bathyarchaeota archaeon]